MTTFGVDVSRYQPGLSVADIKKTGAQFLIAQVSHGSKDPDPEYARFLKEAKNEQVLFAAYHFLHDTDPAGQAKNVAAHIGDKSIPVMLDLESSKSGGKPTLRLAAQVRTELSKLGIAATLLYYPHWYWNSTGSPKLAGWNLVQSAYPSSAKKAPKSLYPGDGHADWTAFGGKTPVIWQYASSGTITGYTKNTVDCDAFRGTRAELAGLGLFKDFAPHKTPKKHPNAEQIIPLAKAGVAANKGASKTKFQEILKLAQDLAANG